MKEFLNSDFIQVVFSLILALGAVVVYNVSRYLYSKSTSIKNNIISISSYSAPYSGRTGQSIWTFLKTGGHRGIKLI